MLGLTDPSIFYENLRQRLSELIPSYADGIEQLGLLDETAVVKLNTPLDTLSNYLSKRLAFSKIHNIRNTRFIATIHDLFNKNNGLFMRTFV